MFNVRIDKESVSKVLEEKISIYIEDAEAKSYIDLVKKTWPSTRIEVRQTDRNKTK